jgi:hypothetical protein
MLLLFEVSAPLPMEQRAEGSKRKERGGANFDETCCASHVDFPAKPWSKSGRRSHPSRRLPPRRIPPRCCAHPP